jgi:nucleotide-binding universal stress UspA family protein
VGRRGMSKLKDLILGSVSTKLFERLRFVPLLLIGKNSIPDKFLIALDGSENALRCVDYVGTMLEDSEFEVTLMHVIRAEDRDFIEKTKKAINELFEEAKKRLERSGFKSNQISTKITTGKQSRAGTIVGDARREGYGTIVVGRRGLSELEEFSMGRVTNKVVYMAKGLAVWVVN